MDNRCPCCGGKLVMYDTAERTSVIMCNDCFFRCNAKDLERFLPTAPPGAGEEE